MENDEGLSSGEGGRGVRTNTSLSPATRIAGIYFLLAASWIKGSDHLLGMFTSDPDQLVALSKLKGLFFVSITTLLLYFLVRSSFKTLQSSYGSLQRAEELSVAQKHLWEMIGSHTETQEVFDSLLELIESQSPGVRCSILLLDPEEKRLHHASARSLPQEYLDSIDGLRIGPEVGSCGSAAFHKQSVVVEDIATDPRWAGATEMASKHDLRACWSSPIFDVDRETVLGTFAIYNSKPGKPNVHQLELLEIATHVAAVALEQKRAQEALIATNRNLEAKVIERTRALEVAASKAESADRLKSAFLATMSHELRTPLNSIIGFTGILLQGLAGPLNDEQNKQLKMVQSSSRHLLALINDVLDLSKIEAGQLKIDSEPVEVEATLKSTLASLETLALQKDLTLTYRIDPEVTEITSDPRRFKQILINFVNNAIKFTEKGEVSIEASKIQSDEGPFLKISVSDTGMGIRAADLESIFQAFSQLDTGITRIHEGTGLGLAICKRLAHLLGGRIEVQSEWGKGSTFKLFLPY